MKKKTRLLLLFAAFVVIALIWTQIPLSEWIEQFRLWVVGSGVFGILVYVAAYSVFAVFLAPVSLLTVAAGLAFGFWGLPLVVFSATLAATVSFLLGRYALRDKVLEWISKDVRLLSLNQAVSAEGWRVVGLLRLSPFVPFGMQNYFFSIAEIKLGPYVLASAIGMMPGTALYVYIGALGQAVGRAGLLQWLLIVAGLVATGFTALFLAKRAKALFAAQLQQGLHQYPDIEP